MDQPLLSVCLITYNHENYIRQAIDGILMQQVNFSWELIIADDCSTDQTRKIIEDYKLEHPNFIKLILRDKNVGAAKNFIELISTPKSKYIAYLEGDDFWTDKNKLQKQVDFLEANPEFEVCFTNTRVIDSTGDVVYERLIRDDKKTEYVLKDLPIWAPSLTRVFKNRDFNPIDKDVPGQDTLWLLYQSKFGKLKFINEITGSYRKHSGGIYSAQVEAKRKEHIILTDIACLEFVDASLYSKYFGMMFKKLVEIKALDSKLFSENIARVKGVCKQFRSELSFFQSAKISFSFFLLKLPFLSKSVFYKKILLKLINNMFIYSK